MSRNGKLIAAGVMFLLGAALIAWNLRDPDAAYREPPEEDKSITIEQAPPAVQATVKRIIGTGKLDEIQEEKRGTVTGTITKYEVEIIRGNVKTEYDIAPDGSIIEQKSKRLKK